MLFCWVIPRFKRRKAKAHSTFHLKNNSWRMRLTISSLCVFIVTCVYCLLCWTVMTCRALHVPDTEQKPDWAVTPDVIRGWTAGMQFANARCRYYARHHAVWSTGESRASATFLAFIFLRSSQSHHATRLSASVNIRQRNQYHDFNQAGAKRVHSQPIILWNRRILVRLLNKTRLKLSSKESFSFSYYFSK